MPYRKNYKKNGRPGYYRCGKMVYGDAAKALRMAKYVKGLVNVEFKRIHHENTNGAITVTPIIVTLTSTFQGDTSAHRDGNSVRFVSIELAYHIVQHASATDTAVRVLLVKDNQTNETEFSAGDVLHDVSSSDGIISSRQQDHLKRFNILYDKVHLLNSAGSAQAYAKTRKKLNLTVQYDGNAGTVADQTEKSLHLLYFANESTNTPTITYMATLRFIDN